MVHWPVRSQASSIFFRDVLSTDTVVEPGAIPLIDDELENADALLNFLDCITGKDISDLLADMQEARRLITLLFKYDCPTILTAMRWQIRLLATSDLEAHNAFEMCKLCLALDDPIGVRDLIPEVGRSSMKAGGNTVAERDQATASQAVWNTSALDPTGMSIDTLSAMSPKYLVAFMRGYAKRGEPGKDGKGGDWAAVAEEFYRVYMR